jgi:NAD(P) transhydrogenase subunit alpha
VKLLIEKQITCFALELLPRISRAQSMDVLSSQAAVAGYECALIAADHSPKFFPMLTYAAGTIRPAKVLVIGAGVAGLQAIATAKRLGAMVSGYDVRPETKEQIESLGAKFVDTGVSAAGRAATPAS